MTKTLLIALLLSCVTAHAVEYIAVFDRPPQQVPTGGMPDGPLLGNGDVGVVIAGPPEAQVFYVDKNDFWRSKPAGKTTVGTVRLAIPALQGAAYRQEQDLARAEVRGTFTTPILTVQTRSWVAATANLLVTELSSQGSASVTVSVDQGVGGGHSIDGKSGVCWFTRRADPEEVPGGRYVTVATRILGAAPQAGNDVLTFELKPGKQVLVVSSVVTDLDARDHLSAARKMVTALDSRAIATMEAKRLKWWSAFWAKSFIEIPDKLIEKHWYGALYILGCCSREGKIAPGLWGNWVTSDAPNWHGDYTLNYNFQAPYYICYSANHPELSLPLYKAIDDFIPKGREMATTHGWKGVHYPTHIGPWALMTEGWEDWGQRSDAAYAAINFIMYYEHTRDKSWLKTVGYPFLIDVADFWENYLKFESGRYVIYNDSIHEGSGPDCNGVLSLGLVHTLFKSMLAFSQDLGVDADRRAKWQHILDNLSDYPLQVRGGNTIFRYTEVGLDWNGGNGLGIQHIYPAGAIGLDSDPGMLNISRHMIEQMGRWTDGNCFSSFYAAAARVGYDPADILRHLHDQCEHHALPNLILSYGGGGIESCGGFVVIDEMLLQSHEGVIRLFPCWPRDQEARFGSLRAVGAFLVSAERKGGAVTGVTIVSEKGSDCAVQNPWPGKAVHVVRKGGVAQTLSGDRLEFKTAVNEQVELKPE